MAGFNKEITKKVTELKTGIHLVSIIDASIWKDENGNPKLTDKGETGIVIKFADGNNHVFENVYYLKGDREVFFKKMCSSAKINLEEVAKTGKFKAEALGKRLWLFIKEVWDIDQDTPVLDDLTNEPVIRYYIFDTASFNNPDVRPSKLGDPAKNNGIATDDFVEYRQVRTSQAVSTPPKQEKVVIEAKDDFDDFPSQPTINTQSGAVKANEAMAKVYNNLPPKPIEDASTQMEEEIDFT